jgi:SAM-dependent methyltransferase
VPFRLSIARRIMAPLRYTILHPQWLVLRCDALQRRWVRTSARGLVLDIGSADGRAREWLENCEYIALDYPTTAVHMYGTRPDVFADGAKLPFLDATFDTVLLLEVLEHVADAPAVLDEIARVLKPGGRLLLSVPFLYPLHDAPHDYRRYTAPGLEAAIRGSGLAAMPAQARNGGFEAAAMLASIACAEAALSAWRLKSWRIVLSPLAVVAVPMINAFGWLAARLSPPSALLASGHAIEARKAP